MPAPCFEHQVTAKDPTFNEKAEKAFWDGQRLGINPQVAKAFYNEAKRIYDTSMMPQNRRPIDFNTMVKIMSEDSGLREETIAKILNADKKTKSIMTDMWIKQARHREITQAADMMVEKADDPRWAKGFDLAWDLSRRSATAFHGGVLPFTHLRNLLFGTQAERQMFFGAVKRAYSYATPNVGRARWERDMANMVTSNDYKDAVRWGVEARPGDKPVGILANVSRGWGIRGFDALKPSRVQLFKTLKDQMGEVDEGSLRQLAKEVNYATGAIKLPAKATRTLGYTSFAPKLWIAKRMEGFSPLRYFAKAGKMTPAERSVANIVRKRWARNVVTVAGLLGANDLFNKYVLGGKNRVNWHDFDHPGTLWRMNIGGTVIPTSPLVEVVRTPVAMVAALMMTKKKLHGEAPASFAAQIAAREVLNALHPSIVRGIELVSGREMFGQPGHLRRLPSLPIPGTDKRFPGVAQLVRGEEPEREPPISWAEYGLEQTMIPMAAAAREIFSPALQEEGVPKSDSDKWVNALLHSVMSGVLGVHGFTPSPPHTGRGKMEKEP